MNEDKQTPQPPEKELFDHERLDVYVVALDFLRMSQTLLEITKSRFLRDQLSRASDSIVANIGEGAGKTSRVAKQAAYEIARGSAMECAALLDIIVIRELPPHDLTARARSQLLRVVKMLSRLAGPPRNASS